MSIWNRENLSFGFLSTRFAGTDGVSLETEKWVDVLRGRGCSVCYLAGELDTSPNCPTMCRRPSSSTMR